MNDSLAALKQFFKTESAGGMLLMAAALLAMMCANTALGGLYHTLLHTPLGYGHNLEWFINDGLMPIFFLLIGLEIKREMMEGELATLKQAALPLIAACGGVVIPAVLYVTINWQHPDALRGWAVPTATDIAFALGVLAVFGSRVPIALKVFLTAVAVIDDLMAILIIAFFYTEQLSLPAIMAAVACLLILLAFNRMGVRSIALFLAVGVGLWFAVLQSGVHATLAGVALGLLIPHRNHKPSMLLRLEHGLHPWVAFGILPLFAFANAGVAFAGLSLGSLLEPVTLGIIVGLFVGKQIGVSLACLVAVRLGLAAMPAGVSWRQLYAVCVLCGVGFTMSLFIGSLAFEGDALMLETRLGVMVGSTLSALVACALLAYSSSGRR